jgi:hypothetical protein
MRAIYQEYLEYISQDVTELEKKDFLIEAMSSHLKHQFNLDQKTALSEARHFLDWRKSQYERT